MIRVFTVLMAMVLPAHAFDGKPVEPVAWNADREIMESDILFRAEQLANAGSPLARALGEDEIVKMETKIMDAALATLTARTRR